MSSKENYPNKSIDFTDLSPNKTSRFTVNTKLHHCTRVYSQHVGATGDRELKQKDAHSKFHKNKQILL
jgi:hypothetical protein